MKIPKPVTMWVDGHDMTPGLQKIVGHVFGETEFRSGWSRYTIGKGAWRTKKEALAARKASGNSMALQSTRPRPQMTAIGAPYDHSQAPDLTSRGHGTGHAGERPLTTPTRQKVHQ